MTLYNVSELAEGSNIVEWIVIFNSWSDGIVFAGMSIAMVLVIFGVMKLQNVETDTAIISAGFIGFLITTLLWLIEFNGERLVPTLIPFMLLIITASAVFMKMIRDWI